jgi:hypothetical protein
VRAALITVALVVACARVALATPVQDLASAREAFRAGQFIKARQMFNDLLYPNPQLASADDLAEAYVDLGVCRLETGDDAGAKREFEKSLSLDPNHQLDPLVITNKAAIRLFDDTKAEIKSRAERAAQNDALRAERERYQKLKESLVVVEPHPYYLNFIPFGAGQFQNSSRIKGILFAAGEGLTFSASVGTWFYLVNKYGVNCPHCVATGDAGTVLQLQQLEIGAGLVFAGLYLWGVVDALYFHKPQTVTKADDSLIRDLERGASPTGDKPKTKPKKTTVLDRIHLTPMATPDGVGLGLGWEN